MLMTSATMEAGRAMERFISAHKHVTSVWAYRGAATPRKRGPWKKPQPKPSHEDDKTLTAAHGSHTISTRSGSSNKAPSLG